ncbi:MAG TPA: MBL fold metallo-hydrolase, partial [Allosphingosinicella sp.]|nr:MBL fold metallo-hydrolase [Allosphingosinicella sp.]
IAANIERLGFRLRDVKLILTSHEHVDHVGGVAALQRLTGATVAARAEAAPALASGTAQAGDPQHGALAPFPAIAVGRTLRDNEVVRLGPIALTAHATPGHTAGSTSWSWLSCEGRACLTIVYADSLSAVSAEGYRFSDHRDEVSAFRRSIARIGALRCDLLLTPHPGASDLFRRLASGRLADSAGCRAYAVRAGERLDERLQQERGR